MDRKLRQNIVDCLRVPAGCEESVRCFRAYNARAWKQALRWLDASGLALVFWQHQKDIGADRLLEPEAAAQLTQNLHDNRVRVQQMAEECDALNRFFEAAGVEYALLKGFALIPDYASDPFLRTQYDHDYLLSSASLGRADRILRGLGYVRKNQREEYSLVYVKSGHDARLPSCRDELYSARLQRSVELHFKLWAADQEEIDFTLPEDALARVRLRNRQGLRFFALADEDALAFQIIHTFRHILNNWCRLSLFFEMAHFMREHSSDQTLWDRLRARLRNSLGWSLAGGIVFSLATDLFGCEIPPDVDSWTRGALTPTLALWLQQYGRRSALENFCGDKFSLLLHREFVHDSAAWRGIRRRRLFPLRMPHRATPAANPRYPSRLQAALKQRAHELRRLKFHLVSALRYAWELPRWERRIRRQKPAASKDSPMTRVAVR